MVLVLAASVPWSVPINLENAPRGMCAVSRCGRRAPPPGKNQHVERADETRVVAHSRVLEKEPKS